MRGHSGLQQLVGGLTQMPQWFGDNSKLKLDVIFAVDVSQR
jgi:hypothetical protein